GQKHAGGHARNFRDVDRPFQPVLDVADEVVLVHLAAGAAGDTGVAAAHQQCTLAAEQTARRCRHTLNDIGMPAFYPFVPPPVGAAAHRSTLVFVDVLGAFGIIGDVFPVRVFEIVGHADDFHAGAGHYGSLSQRWAGAA